MARAPYTTNERNVIALTGIGHFSTHFFELMYPTLAVILARDTGVPLQRVLSWSFLGYLLFGLGALPVGLVADHLGARRLLIVAMAGLGVCALAAAEATSATTITLSLAGIGLFASVYHPAGMSLISHTIAARGRALGINGIFGNLAIAATPVVTAASCSRLGWRGTYLVVGYVTCAVAVGCAFLKIDETPLPHHEAEGQRMGSEPSGMVLFALLCVASMLAGISYRGNTVVQPAYFSQRVAGLGFGATTSLVYLLGVIGQYVGGRLADRHDLRWLYLSFHALSLPALLAMSFLSGVLLIGTAALFVFFSLGMQPIENSLFARFTPSRWRATGYGIKFVFTFGVGSLAVRLVEWVQSGGDLSLVFVYLSAVVLLLLGTILVFITVSAGRSIRNVPVAVEANI
jgi:MFS family permease